MTHFYCNGAMFYFYCNGVMFRVGVLRALTSFAEKWTLLTGW